MSLEPYNWKNDPKKILMESHWEELRRRLDDLGQVIHRSEDPETRLAFVRLVEAFQHYDDASTR